MKKIKILVSTILIFFFSLSYTNACMWYTEYNFAIWRIKKINNNILILDNYINNKILKDYYEVSNKKIWLLNKNILYFWESSCYPKSEATKNIEDWKNKLKSWDIVYLSVNVNTWEDYIPENHVDIIEKVSCQNNKIYIWNNYDERLDKKIGWCSNLSSFFNQDRTFEDLEWNNLHLIYTKIYIKKYIKENKIYFILLFWIIFIFWIFIYTKVKLWKK